MARGLPKKRPIEGVKNVICVASGKGGVGKSTTAVNLGLALQKKLGLHIGLLDADVYGPSLPILMNLQGLNPLVNEESNKMLPLENYGVKCMSMGFLVKPQDAIVWRGPMVMGALAKLAHGTHWGPLDVLIVDLPPGTGDIQLSLAQTVPILGSVIVSTPQKLATADALKAVKMFQTVQVPILGLIENMASFECPKCGELTRIFGQNTTEKFEDIEVLGCLPLDIEIMKNSDRGTPIVLQDPDSNSAKIYQDIAEKLKPLLHL